MKTTAMKKNAKKNNQKNVSSSEKSDLKRMVVSDMGIGFRVLDFKSNN